VGKPGKLKKMVQGQLDALLLVFPLDLKGLFEWING
jgi:hypothetical protein